MLGSHISVFRMKEGGSEPPNEHTEPQTIVAVWQSDASGLDWIDPLLRQGQATTIRADGYPSLYAVRLDHPSSGLERVTLCQSGLETRDG